MRLSYLFIERLRRCPTTRHLNVSAISKSHVFYFLNVLAFISLASPLGTNWQAWVFRVLLQEGSRACQSYGLKDSYRLRERPPFMDHVNDTKGIHLHGNCHVNLSCDLVLTWECHVKEPVNQELPDPYMGIPCKGACKPGASPSLHGNSM